ncbi:phospholipase D-like domain-containing protein [Zavarzinia sp.]|uniref:phospholipase D-like domain-containing protein n=1 Tax=Zavarzinia sp. TaxID=2027920 RepID=UPI00356AA959
MRVRSGAGGFDLLAIGGSNVVLLAIDATPAARKGLLGFALKRSDASENQSYWLKGLKVFEEVVPQPRPGDNYSTLEHPIQSFLWGDYTAKPGHRYGFVVRPVYGTPRNLRYGEDITVEVETEREDDGTHAVFFNRGAIASQAFADKFGNKAPENQDDPKDPEVVWLSRGLLEAALAFIDDTRPDEKLRVAAYEFTYPPILNALATARKTRGVDVVVVYEAGQETVKKARVDTEATTANRKAIAAAGLPKAMLKPRTQRHDIPHNKFMVRLSPDRARTAVWTGSTNFTASGFLGQANVGHIVRDPTIAKTYLAYWEKLAADTEWNDLRDWNRTVDPDPAAALPANSVTPVFSPRRTDSMLDWYAGRIREAGQTVMFTAPFGIDAALAGAFSEDRPFLRYIILEKPPGKTERAIVARDRDVQIAYGAALGRKTVKTRIPGWQLDKWFLDEGHYRYEGHVFYVHTKILLVDPAGDDPLVFSGSANFSHNSLVNNDENMLLIRGDTRVADIYMTEYDRIFRHFYFRNMANELAEKGKTDTAAIFLDPSDKWVAANFSPEGMKSKRRKLFFGNSKN